LFIYTHTYIYIYIYVYITVEERSILRKVSQLWVLSLLIETCLHDTKLTLQKFNVKLSIKISVSVAG